MKNPRIPFEINRHSGIGLVDQVVDGFRRSIRSGLIPSGTRLPSREEVAHVLGVSVRVSRAAFSRLAAESLVSIRPRIGGGGLASNQTFWRRRVVAVVPALYQATYYVAVVVSEIQRRLARYGCLFECVALTGGRSGGMDVRPLEEAMRQPADLVFAFFENRAVLSMLARKGVPSICLGTDDCSEIHGMRFVVRTERPTAFAKLADHCRKAGVRRVLVVGYGIFHALVAQLRECGAAVETCSVPDKFGHGYLEAIQHDAMLKVIARFSRPSRPKPELVVVTDDFVARGVLSAFSELGIRSPDDMRLVVAVNKGFGPVYPRTLARIETDPWRDAETFAAASVAVMDGKAPDEIVSGVKYLRGATFP